MVYILVCVDLGCRRPRCLICCIVLGVNRAIYCRVECKRPMCGVIVSPLDTVLGADHNWRRQMRAFSRSAPSCACSAIPAASSAALDGDSMAGDAGARKEIRNRISKSVPRIDSEVDLRPARGAVGKKKGYAQNHSRAIFCFALVVGRTTSAQIHGKRYGHRPGRARGGAIRSHREPCGWCAHCPTCGCAPSGRARVLSSSKQRGTQSKLSQSAD